MSGPTTEQAPLSGLAGIPGPGESWEGRTPTPEQLAEVLRLHGMWLRGEEGGVRANLRGACLVGANLRGVDLFGADLRDANLFGADLCDADLRDACLVGANLRRTDMSHAKLRGADLSRADAFESDLRDAGLSDTDLRGTNLGRTDMRNANLRWACLTGTELYGARGFALLCQTDQGHQLYATLRGAEWRIIAGCRDFSVADALDHWSDPSYHSPSSGRRCVAAIRWLQSELAAACAPRR